MFSLLTNVLMVIFFAGAFLGLFAISLSIGNVFANKDDARKRERKARRTRELNAVYRRAEKEALAKSRKKQQIAEINAKRAENRQRMAKTAKR